MQKNPSSIYSLITKYITDESTLHMFKPFKDHGPDYVTNYGNGVNILDIYLQFGEPPEWDIC